jgi:hypothetical protein
MRLGITELLPVPVLTHLRICIFDEEGNPLEVMQLAEVGPKAVVGVIFGLLQRKSSKLRIKLGLDLHRALQLQRADRIIHGHDAAAAASVVD